MRKRVDFSRCTVDQTPIQLVAKTTLLKVHSLFSLLGINRAYVTDVGRLIGVVAMREVRTFVKTVILLLLFNFPFCNSFIFCPQLRIAIEQCNSGNFKPNVVDEKNNSSLEDLLTPSSEGYSSKEDLDELDEEDEEVEHFGRA